jgi:transcription elongation factor Elf1
MGGTATPSFASQAKSERRTTNQLIFVCTCPVCGQERVQHAYTGRALVRLIEKGQTIDAYCGTCDVVWGVSVQERDGYWAKRD